MSNWYIASEENLEALQHYGVKGMKWGKRTEGFRRGSKNGAEYGAGLNSKSIQVNPIGVKPIMVKSGTEIPKSSKKISDDDKYRLSVEARIKAHQKKENEAKEKAAGGRKVSQEYLNEREHNLKTNNYFGQGSEKKTGGPTYITTDKWGNTVRADSKEELDKINEQKKKDKKEELKKKFKNLTDRIKNTAKGLGK